MKKKFKIEYLWTSCKGFTTWGIADKDIFTDKGDSWIPEDAGPHFVGWGHPLLFDSDYKLKTVCDTLKEELGGTGGC